jgi:hypothetical protein
VIARKRFLTAAEVAALADASGRYRELVYVLAYCGLRLGEVAGLRVGDVDLTRRRLRVERSVSDVDGRLVATTPKTHHAREVPVPAFVAAMLPDIMVGRAADDPLFTGPGGGLLRGNNFRRRFFDRAAATAGLPGVTPHDLRHTAASLAVSAGANVKAVQRMLGHASAAMTLDVYAGLFGDDLDAVADRLDATGRAATRVTSPAFPAVGSLGIEALMEHAEDGVDRYGLRQETGSVGTGLMATAFGERHPYRAGAAKEATEEQSLPYDEIAPPRAGREENLPRDVRIGHTARRTDPQLALPRQPSSGIVALQFATVASLGSVTASTGCQYVA